jgi:hypothetical protein
MLHLLLRALISWLVTYFIYPHDNYVIPSTGPWFGVLRVKLALAFLASALLVHYEQQLHLEFFMELEDKYRFFSLGFISLVLLFNANKLM